MLDKANLMIDTQGFSSQSIHILRWITETCFWHKKMQKEGVRKNWEQKRAALCNLYGSISRP